MMRVLVAMLLVLCAARAEARWGTNDVSPTAMGLIPYFEVDTRPDGDVTTVVTLANNRSLPSLAWIAIWSDQGELVWLVSVYLLGYDVEVFDLGLFLAHGFAPATGGAISPAGSLTIPGAIDEACTGERALTETEHGELLAALRGRPVAARDGKCVAAPVPDDEPRVRGYMTVALHVPCYDDTRFPIGPENPSDPHDHYNMADLSWAVIDRANGAVYGDTAVPIDFDYPPPLELRGAPNFYDHLRDYVGAIDGGYATQFEATGTHFALPYDTAREGAEQSVIVWRGPDAGTGAFDCATGPTPRPLTRVVAFDDDGEATDVTRPNPFPHATQRVALSTLGLPASGTLEIDFRNPAPEVGNVLDPSFRNGAVLGVALPVGVGARAAAWPAIRLDEIVP